VFNFFVDTLILAQSSSSATHACSATRVKTKSLLRYQLLLRLLSPWLLFSTLRQALKVRSWRFVSQRLGFAYHDSPGCTVWVHCASVGEVNAVRPLIDQLQQLKPSLPLVLSTTTPTGAETVARIGWPNLVHQFLPVDFRYAIKRALAANRPSVLLIVETEIWPNLINVVRDEGVPVLIVNGRLSQKTLRVPGWFKPVYRQVLARVNAILCKSQSDARAFSALGGIENTIETIGNIKFSTATIEQIPCDTNRPYWLAASTHQNEELLLCGAIKDSSIADKLLVIAPRHPSRSEEIQKVLEDSGLRYAVRSKSELPTADTQVYLADTLGEMDMWFGGALLVFMGGSLVPVGGHNLLEPAAAGVAILSGPHLENVADEAVALTEAGAMRQVTSAEELIAEVGSIINEPAVMSNMGRVGKQVVFDNKEVLQNYIQAILPFITAE